MEVIREELEAVKAEFGDARRTEIVASQVDLTIADLITEEDRVVTISTAATPSPNRWPPTRRSVAAAKASPPPG